MSCSTVYINQVGDDAWSISLHQYDELLIGVIKRAVPWAARSWNPSLKEWVIKSDHVNALRTVFSILGCEICDHFAPGRFPDDFAGFLAAIDDDAAL